MNALVFPILRLLSDGALHSASSISEQLKCSYHDIRNTVDEFETLGITLISTNDCYRWNEPVQWLDAELILQKSGLSNDLYLVTILDVAESTNNFLLDQYREKHHETTSSSKASVVAAELQTCGRGRLNRRWHSGFGDSLTFSVGRCFNKDACALTGLSLVIGLAILRTLNHFSIVNVNLKWPNDIVSKTHYQKLAGILIDFKSLAHRLSYVVIGIGVNFNLRDEVKAQLERPVTDLFTLAGRKIDRNFFCGKLLIEMHYMLINFEQYGFKYFKEEWISSHAFEGKRISMSLPDCSVIEGIAQGVGDDGALHVLTAEGLKSFHAGDVSISISDVCA